VVAHLVLIGAGFGLLTLAMIQGRGTPWFFQEGAAPLQILTLLALAGVLWAWALQRFARDSASLRRPQRAVTDLFQGVGLDVGALYLTGYAYILAHLLIVGPFPFDRVNLAEIGGPTLLGEATVGWGAFRFMRLLRPT
jgi:hypothetical protein